MSAYVLSLLVSFLLMFSVCVGAQLNIFIVRIFDLSYWAVVGLSACLFGALAVRMHVAYLAALPVAVVFGGATAVVLLQVCRQLSADGAALATLALAIMIEGLMRSGVWFTQGPQGVSGIGPFRPDRSFTFNLYVEVSLGLVLSVAACLLWRLVRRQPLSTALAICGADPVRAQLLGLRAGRLQGMVMGASGAIAGGAGVLFAVHYTVVSAASFPVAYAFAITGAVFAGGGRSLAGAAVSGTALTVLPELVTAFIPATIAGSPLAQIVLSCALVVLILRNKGMRIGGGRPTV